MDNLIKNIGNEEEEIRIDLWEIGRALKHRLWVIVLTALLLGGAAGIYSSEVIIPQYSSQAMLYVLSKETTLTSLADLQIGSQLTKDYAVMVTSRPVLQSVIDETGLNLDYEELRAKISVSNPSDTRILTVAVTDPDPKMAKELVDKVAQTSSDFIGDIMEMIPPKMIEDGEVTAVPRSPDVKKNAVVGAVAGLLLACVAIIARTVLDDTIKTEEDVERHLNVSVLASVPKRTVGKTGPDTKRKTRRRGGKENGKKHPAFWNRNR